MTRRRHCKPSTPVTERTTRPFYENRTADAAASRRSDVTFPGRPTSATRHSRTTASAEFRPTTFPPVADGRLIKVTNTQSSRRNTNPGPLRSNWPPAPLRAIILYSLSACLLRLRPGTLGRSTTYYSPRGRSATPFQLGMRLL